MELRQKSYGVGSEVRLKECHAYPLPKEVPAGLPAVVMERHSGGAMVKFDLRGKSYEVRVAMQNVDSGWEYNLAGVGWLDETDRRVIKERRREEREGVALRAVN